MADETQTPAPETPQVTIVDLQNVVSVIDAAAERGAFKGNELSSVGAVRDKIAAFVSFAAQSEEAAASAPAEKAEGAE